MQQNMDRYLKGREPTLSAILKICLNLGVSADWLLGLADGARGDRASVTASNSTVAIGGSAGGDCANCPLMKAAASVVSGGARKNNLKKPS